MPRNIPVGNGQMLVAFDDQYQIRDLYFPFVGQENQVDERPCKFGVWGKLPAERLKNKNERRRSHVYWSDSGWDRSLKYRPDTLATDVEMTCDDLMVQLRCSDVVDYHRPVMVRRIEVANQSDEEREVRLLHHHNFHLYGTDVGDTAYYDPQLKCMIHYRKERYIMCGFYLDSEQRTDQYATGNSGFGGAEGTWRDAEDGQLGMNAIAQGSVDSTILCSVKLAPHETRTAYLVIGCGHSYNDCEELNAFLHEHGPQHVIDRTEAYWKLWLTAARTGEPRRQSDIENGTPSPALSERVDDLYKRSLLVVRTQIDSGGAILAANDSDYLQYNRDTYSYLWPRDGAFVADAMDAAGFPDVSRRFYAFCARVINKRGMFLHKYCPDGSPGSSWHPWVDAKGQPQMPIQEDETALVIWSLWRHYARNRDIEFVRPLWVKMIQPAADFMCKYRDPDTKLPLPSYDLWEERWGVHAFTVATVYGGLRAACKFAESFGDNERASKYNQAAEEVRDAFCGYLWSKDHGRFLRRINPIDTDRVAGFMADLFDGREPQPTHADAPLGDTVWYEPDLNVDASMFAIFSMGLLPADDERVKATMKAVEDRLTIKTPVGGVARYVNDYYQQVSQDTENIPGNPWFICTLWMADYRIACARTEPELEEARVYLDWVAERALPSGVLAEQVHPETNAPLSVSPLTWSHATVVATVVNYRNKLRAIREAKRAGEPVEPGPDEPVAQRDAVMPLPV
ncbi:glycoside hydrolase family 15 protein [Phycisphaeraceae bacterium D3-23]